MSSQDDSEDSNLVIIPVDDSLSDGNIDTWPLNDSRWAYERIDDSYWRDGLAEMWLQKEGAYESGTQYSLEKLPEGFALFDRPRGTDPRFRDKFLFGHPSGFYFQSRNTFFPHFYWLMKGRPGSCECAPCNRAAKGGVPHVRRTKAEMKALDGGKGKAKGKKKASLAPPAVDPSWPCDKEGPDYWKVHIMKLKENRKWDEEIDHPLNMDWVTTHEWLADYFIRLTLQPAFLPRRGELVLWAPEIDGTLEYNQEANCHQVQGDDGSWRGMPDWRAGVVTQTPEEPSSFLDIVQLTEKENKSVSYYGFRVETLPDPLADDKSYSLQYKYLPLKCIKPFGAFERFIHPTTREDFHPSIEHALTVMSSWSIVSNMRFVGSWPNAGIYCRGIYIGAELIALKDTVRLKPFGLKPEDMEEDGGVIAPEYDPVDVMVVEKIQLQLEGCIDDPQNPQLAQRITPLVIGKVYTRDENRLSRPIMFGNDPLQKMSFDETVAAFYQVGMHGYGNWYRVAGGRTCVVSQNMIVGRCYEPQATALYYGVERLDYDLHSVLNGRRYSSQADSRIPRGIEWFWGDNRVETLGLESVNGVECGDAAEQRENPTRWQAILKILMDRYTEADVERAQLPRRVGRPSGKTTFKEVSKTSTLVSSGLGGLSEVDDSIAEDTNGDGVNSEMDLSESELIAPIPFISKSEDMDHDPSH